MQNQNIPIRVIVRNTDRQAGKRKTRISFFSKVRFSKKKKKRKEKKKMMRDGS